MGTNHADVIHGTARADVIVGLGGDDRIYGLGGNDVICGGAGADFVDGGAGVDTVIDGAGRNACLNVERRFGCPIDNKRPVLVKAVLVGSTINATFDEWLDPAQPPDPAAVLVSANGLSVPVASAHIAGRVLVVALKRPVYADDHLTIAWDYGLVFDLSDNGVFPQDPVPVSNATAPAGCNAYVAPADQFAASRQIYPGLPVPGGFLPSIGTLHAMMLFVDFADAPGAGTPDVLYQRFADTAENWYSQVSYGRLQLSVTPVLRWLRMPQPSSSYGVSRLGDPRAYTAYLQQAIAVADPSVDFAGTDIVYVIATPGSAIGIGTAWWAVPEDPLAVVDGATIHEAAGEPGDLPPRSGPNFVFAHETGHLLGLPDLYDFAANGDADQFAFVGNWDLLSNDYSPAGLLGWQRWELGWLDGSQIRCVGPGETLSTTLTPLEATGGLKMIVVPTGPTTATVIEDRQPINEDSAICYSGLLVYDINTAHRSGDGPLRVAPAHGDAGVDTNRCGLLAHAPVAAGETFTDPASNVRITATPAGAGISATVSSGK